MNLEGVDIFQAETVRRAAKIPAELRYRVEVRLLRRRRQIADRHVFDHAAAKRADLSHWKTSCLKGWASKTLNPLRQEAITATAPYLNCRVSGFVQSQK